MKTGLGYTLKAEVKVVGWGPIALRQNFSLPALLAQVQKCLICYKLGTAEAYQV